MAETLEVRIAHLEGAYEQIDRRLASVEAGLIQVRQEMGQLRQEIREQFRWLLGFQIVTWLTILGALLTNLFRQ